MTGNTGDHTSGNDTATVMRRKLSAGSEGTTAAPARPLLRTIIRSLARAAAELCELPIAVPGATQKQCSADEMAQHLSDSHLLIVLDGPDGACGALSLDAALVTAVLQQQTMGLVSGPAPHGRKYTGTDAALIAPLVDAMLLRTEEGLEGAPDQYPVKGFRYGARAEDSRSLALLLDASVYQVISLSLDLAAGCMQGSVIVILPEKPLTSEDEVAEGIPGQGPSLSGCAGGVRAELTAVLTQIRMSLEELAGLQTGDTLQIAATTLNSAELRTIDGKPVASGRLGQSCGARAIRLHGNSAHRSQGLRAASPEDFAADISPAKEVAPCDDAADLQPEPPLQARVENPAEPKPPPPEDTMDLIPEQVAGEASDLSSPDESVHKVLEPD